MTMNNKDLEDHHIYLLQIMAQPADVQINEYAWDADDVPVGIFSFWTIAFTGSYGNSFDRFDENILPGFDEDIVEIDQKRVSVVGLEDDYFWSNDALRNHPFWDDIRSRAKSALARRGIPLKKPDPNGWYLVLPEELH
jgi:hypothetical protein